MRRVRWERCATVTVGSFGEGKTKKKCQKKRRGTGWRSPPLLLIFFFLFFFLCWSQNGDTSTTRNSESQRQRQDANRDRAEQHARAIQLSQVLASHTEETGRKEQRKKK